MTFAEGSYENSMELPEGAVDPVELFDFNIAGRKVQERQDEIGRQHLIECTLGSLPNASNSGFTIEDPIPEEALKSAKAIQASIIWDGDCPLYIIGRRPTDNPKCTELLTACAIRGSRYWIRRTVVHKQDFEAWQDTAQMILQPGSYTQSDLGRLRCADGSVRITRYHRLSGHFREDAIFVPFRLMRADVTGKGIRQQEPKMSQLKWRHPLSAVDMETFEVAAGLEQLSRRFGTLDVFQSAHKDYLAGQYCLKETQQ